MKLRDYQQDIFEQLIAGSSNDIVQLDTGAGKTPIEAALAEWAQHTLLVAHRNILIQQISEKLAAFGLEHDTISTEHTRRRCMGSHRRHGRNFIKRGHATRRVASMQSIIAAVRRHRLDVDTLLPWLIVIDEAHHVIPDNMWGGLRELFPNARIVGFTATPARMDGESLHVSKGGLFDRLVQARTLGNDSARVLINRGYLSGFTVYAAGPIETPWEKKLREDPIYALTLEAIDGPRISSADYKDSSKNTGALDWKSGILQLAGDPVKEYIKRAKGRPAIMMCPAIKNAELFALAFRGNRIPAACINSTQSAPEVSRILDAFRSGRIHVLTNVDMIGEGFDLPACEVLIIASMTASFPRYRQWCGRVLRPAINKEGAVIIDLTGMCAIHGLPDEPVEWDLINPPCGPKQRIHIPCDDCGAFFPIKIEQCPYCGWHNEWLERPKGFSPGSYGFDIRYVDQELIYWLRNERRKVECEHSLRTELLRSHDGFGSDLLGRTITGLAAWFPGRLCDAGIPIFEVNTFLRSKEARDREFWIKHFTAADARKTDSAKALKVYQKWLKSQSSRATQKTLAARAK